MNNKRKSIGFTVIELLVVLVTIVLSVSILLPTLSKNRALARGALCQNNLRQWGFIFRMYTNDNNNEFWGAWYSSAVGHRWIGCTKAYYNDPNILFCPTAKVPRDNDGVGVTAMAGMSVVGATKASEAWGRFADVPAETRIGYRGMASSYGTNEWVSNPYIGKTSFVEQVKFWPQATISGGYMVPVFMGARWLGVRPHQGTSPDTPPITEADVYTTLRDSIARFLVNRHDGFINTVFMDGAARKVGLKELWTLKWHQSYENKDPSKNVWISKSAPWPAWMKDFSDQGLLD